MAPGVSGVARGAGRRAVVAAVVLVGGLPWAYARAGAADAPGARVVVPFAVGERLTYDVSWSTYATAGTLTLDVKGRTGTGAQQAYAVVAEAQPTPLLSRLYTLYYKAETFIDPGTMLPHRNSIFSREGHRQRTRNTRFDRPTRTAHFEQVGGIKKQFAVPASVQDALSVIYLVRTAALRPGAVFKTPVVDGWHVYTALLSVSAPEPVETGIGTIRAYRITPKVTDEEGNVEERRMTLWVSEDARRLPVRMEAELMVGKFAVTLRDVARVTASR